MREQEIIEKVAKAFEVDSRELLSPSKSGYVNDANLADAKNALVFLLKEEGLSYKQVAEVLERSSKGSIHSEYKLAKELYDTNFRGFANKINEIKNLLPQQELPTAQTMKTPEQDTQEPEIISEEPTPEPISVEESPLSEPVIERDISQILRPEAEKIKNTNLLEELEALNSFEQEIRQENPQTKPIPELSFETPPNDDPKKVKIQMDEETADFSTESILNVIEFGSVELALYYARVPEREVKDLEEAGKVPEHSTEVSREFNENAREKLEDTAKSKIKLLAEPLKKVLKAKNVSVSPEAALVLAFLMFSFAMFMTAKSLKKDADYFLEKIQKMNKKA